MAESIKVGLITKKARLIKKIDLGGGISDFKFEALEGRFDNMEPGAHIDVVLGPELIRQYSLWEWDAEGKNLSVAVKVEEEGRGGSIAMHALSEGDEVEIGGPRNHFPIVSYDKPIVLVAGGIGVTPIYAMAAELKQRGVDFKVYYLVRSKEFAAFDEMFNALDLGERYHLHCDDADGFLDLDALVKSVPEGGDVYTCGPEVLLEKLIEACQNLNGGKLHFERFAAKEEDVEYENQAFEIVIDSTNEVLQVPEDKTILSVLQDKGIDIQVGCSNGICGCCMLDVLEGEIDHRDSVMDDEEKAEQDRMCVCVSRAKSPQIVLDI